MTAHTTASNNHNWFFANKLFDLGHLLFFLAIVGSAIQPERWRIVAYTMIGFGLAWGTGLVLILKK